MGSIPKELLAGGVAGMSSLLVVHPLDTIRTRVQVRNTTTIGTVRNLLNEGVTAFYKGMTFPLCAQFAYKATIFGASRVGERFYRSITGTGHDAALPASALALCGSFGGGVNALVVTPVELVRNRLMVQGGGGASVYRGSLDCVRQVVATEGVLTLWRGLSSTLVRDVPGVAAWIATFRVAEGMLKRRAAEARGEDPSSVSLPAYQRMAAGALAGVSFWTVALPADAVKAVIQTDRLSSGHFLRAGAQLVREGGIKRLYRGLPIACARGVPGAAITFTTYSYVRELL